MQSALLTLIVLLLCEAAPTAPDLRSEDGALRRARLQLEVAARPACKLDETSHYFVVSGTADRDIVLELERRAEGLHDWLRSTLADWSGATCCPGPSAPPGSLSMAPKSTLRFFASSIDYCAAGGRDGTTSTYLPHATELLLRAAKGAEGRKQLWRDLQAGIVVGYLDARWGSERQAPWFAHGLELLCAPFGMRDRGIAAKPDRERLALVKELLARDEFVALDELLTTPAEALGQSPELQAQVWSLAWFLQRRHPKLLIRYLDKWREKHDADAATSYAFEFVDRAELERQWRAYIPTIK